MMDCCVAVEVSHANWLIVIFMEEMGLGASHFMRIVISEHGWRDFVMRKENGISSCDIWHVSVCSNIWCVVDRLGCRRR